MKNEKLKNVVTRFAPSPTGRFHVGGIRTALYNYLYARKNNGTFILRSEDTDPIRSKKEYEDYFLELFSWLRLEYDSYYRQSERTDIYREYLLKLISEDKAYVSKESPEEKGKNESVIRFRNPKTRVVFDDVVLGNLEFDTTELGDFIIARNMESPLYHFTVVVDDFLMNVTHIIRGQEHVSNTPRQILIQDAIGAPRPVYAHASVMLNEDRAKLSKRDPIVRPALDYRDEGYLPEAVLNFVALIGWNPGIEKEIFTLAELVEIFSPEKLQKAGAIFNPEKLEWFNKEHMKMLSAEAMLEGIERFLPSEVKDLPQYSEDRFLKVMPIIAERVTHFGQAREMWETGELGYFFETPKYEKLMLRNQEFMGELISIIDTINENDFTATKIKEAVWDFATKKGRGNVLWPMRVALSGREKSPDPFTLAEILGKSETLKRLKYAEGL